MTPVPSWWTRADQVGFTALCWQQWELRMRSSEFGQRQTLTRGPREPLVWEQARARRLRQQQADCAMRPITSEELLYRDTPKGDDACSDY